MSAIHIQASDDPRDLPVAAYQNVQWLHVQRDEIGLLALAARLWRDAYDAGFKAGARKAFEVGDSRFRPAAPSDGSES